MQQIAVPPLFVEKESARSSGATITAPTLACRHPPEQIKKFSRELPFCRSTELTSRNSLTSLYQTPHPFPLQDQSNAITASSISPPKLSTAQPPVGTGQMTGRVFWGGSGVKPPSPCGANSGFSTTFGRLDLLEIDDVPQPNQGRQGEPLHGIQAYQQALVLALV
jgi:hypothetical protein